MERLWLNKKLKSFDLQQIYSYIVGWVGEDFIAFFS